MHKTQSLQVEKLNMGEILFVSCLKNCWAFLKLSDRLERCALSVPISSIKTNYLVFNFFTTTFNFFKNQQDFSLCVRVRNG